VWCEWDCVQRRHPRPHECTKYRPSLFLICSHQCVSVSLAMEAPMTKKLSPDWPFAERRPAHSLFFAILAPSPLEADISNVFENLRQRHRVRKKQAPIPRLHVSLSGVFAADANFARSVNRLSDRITEAVTALSGLKTPRTGPIAPHLTLVRHHMTVPEHPIAPIKLPVRETVLSHSHVGKSRHDGFGRRQLVPFQ
jgi:2'-5' RNA ligase